VTVLPGGSEEAGKEGSDAMITLTPEPNTMGTGAGTQSNPDAGTGDPPAASNGGAAGAAGATDPPVAPPTTPPALPDPCPGAPEPCGSLCVDLSTDGAHCGACNVGCGSNERCSGSACECSGALFPCVAFDHDVPASDYGVLNVAGYRDATHNWVAYSDSTGNAGSTLVFHDIDTQAPFRSIEVPQWEVQLAFLPDEPTLLYSSNGTLSRATENGQPTQLLTGVNWFTLSSDGQTLATLDASNAGVLALRSYPSLATREELTLDIAINNQYERLGFSPDGRWLAVSGLYENVQIQLFDLSNGSTRVLSAVGATGTYSPTFSEDGRELFVGGGYDDGRVYVFDTATGAELRRLTPFSNYLYTVARVPGFRQLLVGGFDGRISIIDAVTGAELWTDSVGHANRAVFSPDGSLIYTGTGAGSGSLVVHSVR
jgi:WD40 repeat protein